jgi:hypothetical protein
MLVRSCGDGAARPGTGWAFELAVVVVVVVDAD